MATEVIIIIIKDFRYGIKIFTQTSCSGPPVLLSNGNYGVPLWLVEQSFLEQLAWVVYRGSYCFCMDASRETLAILLCFSPSFHILRISCEID